jgi:hypothetical protein
MLKNLISNLTGILRARVNEFKNKNCVEKNSFKLYPSLLREFFKSIGSPLYYLVIYP